jgi:hypothetical protein
VNEHRLQINESGAWRNVVSYPAEKETEVKAAVGFLGRVVDATFRLVDVDRRMILAYWDHSNGWHNPFERKPA